MWEFFKLWKLCWEGASSCYVTICIVTSQSVLWRHDVGIGNLHRRVAIANCECFNRLKMKLKFNLKHLIEPKIFVKSGIIKTANLERFTIISNPIISNPINNNLFIFRLFWYTHNSNPNQFPLDWFSSESIPIFFVHTKYFYTDKYETNFLYTPNVFIQINTKLTFCAHQMFLYK